MDNSPYMYVSNFPYGFFEKQIYGYFSQYGTVNRVYLAYNEKTGQSKGYGFVKFDSEKIAEIASDSMNGYYLLDHYIICEIKSESDIIEIFGKDVIDNEECIDADEMEEKRVNFTLASNLKKEYKIKKEEFFSQCKELINQNKKMKEDLKNAGINYEFDVLDVDKLKEHIHRQQTELIDIYEKHQNINENDDLNYEDSLYKKIIDIHYDNLWKLANIDDNEIDDNFVNENGDMKRKHENITDSDDSQYE